MDWLRIGAFALLILYHVGMVFVPWHFHVNHPDPVRWAILPMLAINPWRLSLLFVVSGYASRALLRKSAGSEARGLHRFAWNRTVRLLVPLAFGVAVVVPPQPWVELTVGYGYRAGYWHFWLHDFWRFGMFGPLFLPAWNHLWFVGYLWVYTMLLTLAVLLAGRIDWQRGFDRLFGSGAVLWLPILWLGAVHGWWFVMAGETHALVGDWVAHFSYLPAFLFGFGLARSEAAMAAIGRWWPWGLALAVIGYATVLGIELTWAGEAGAPRWTYRPYGIAHALQQWGGILALIGVAERWWNRDAKVRPILTQAVFPFYIVHQTIIVLAMYALIGRDLPRTVDFLLLVAATVAGCWLFYAVGRRIAPLRPLIGLRLR